MPFKCPKCLGASMKITSSIELPPDSRSDEITVQTIKCTKCGFTGLGIYEETRRGSLNEDCIHNYGIFIDNLTYESMKKTLLFIFLEVLISSLIVYFLANPFSFTSTVDALLQLTIFSVPIAFIILGFSGMYLFFLYAFLAYLLSCLIIHIYKKYKGKK